MVSVMLQQLDQTGCTDTRQLLINILFLIISNIRSPNYSYKSHYDRTRRGKIEIEEPTKAQLIASFEHLSRKGKKVSPC